MIGCGQSPKSMVIVGASSSGVTTLATCRVLAEMDIELPKAICLTFPVVSTDYCEMTPSRAMMSLDPLIVPSTIFGMFESYRTGHDVSYVENRTPWFKRDRDSVRARICDHHQKSTFDPLFNPMIGSFDIFTQTNLLLFACEYDSLLDDSIQLARKWPKSKVELIVVKNVVHSYTRGFITNESIEATRLTVEKIAELFEK